MSSKDDAEITRLRRLLAEHEARDQAKRDLFAESIGVPDPRSVTEHTTIEELYHKAGKLTRSELEAERDSARALLRETLSWIGATSDNLRARIQAELDK